MGAHGTLGRMRGNAKTVLASHFRNAFMETCQLMRKETKMDISYLNQKQLATLWGVSQATLERWRSEGIGPKYLKFSGRVIYRRADIDAYEEFCLVTPHQETGLLTRSC